MWRKCCHAIRARHYVLPLGMLVMLITQTGCPPDRIYVRTRTVGLPHAVQIEPVIVEHMKDLSTYNSQFGEYWHRFETTHYTLKLTDGQEMDVFVGDSPYVVIRNPVNNERIRLGLWSKWSDPSWRWPARPAPATKLAMPTTQEVVP